MRNWMPAWSMARPMTPSSASISRTRWPLARPPMAGLQDISPIVSRRWVSRSVRAPVRAEAAAASQPAWPPPITITSQEEWGQEKEADMVSTRNAPGERGRCWPPYTPKRLGGRAGPPQPANHGDARPYGLDQAEGPGPLQESIGRAHQAGAGEGQDEPVRAPFQGVGHQHGGDGEEAEQRQGVHCGAIPASVFHVKHH